MRRFRLLQSKKETVMSDRRNSRDFRKKIRQHRLTILYRTLIVIALVVAAVAVCYESYRNKIYTGYRIVASAPWEQIEGTSSEILGTNVLIYSKDGARCIDAKGNKLWDETYEMQNPRVEVCQSVAAIGDYNGRMIYIVNESQILGEIHTNLPIKNFCVAANGITAAILDDTDVTWIYVYDTSGNELVCFKTTMKNSGYPLAVSISPNAELFAISYLYVDEGTMKTSVSFYNFGAVGQNYTDNYVSGYDYPNGVVPEIHFVDNKNAIAVADDRIMFYSGQQIPTSVAEAFLNAEVRSVFLRGENAILIFRDTSGEHKYRMDVYKSDGSLEMSAGFDLDYSDIRVLDKKITIYNETDCMVFYADGTQKYAGTFNKPVSLMVPVSGYRYLLVTQDSVETVELE